MSLSASDVLIYHITHVQNLSHILRAECLWCDRQVAVRASDRIRIGYSHLKARRMAKRVPVPPGGVVGDYVPFYFAPRSPMLYTISRGNVEGYEGGQGPILHLVSSIGAVTSSGLRWVFTDGNATSHTTRFFTALNALDEIDWGLMSEQYWHNTPEDSDRLRRRQAEFLVRQSLPWALVHEIGVMTSDMAREVTNILGGLVRQMHRPTVVVRPDWYYW